MLHSRLDVVPLLVSDAATRTWPAARGTGAKRSLLAPAVFFFSRSMSHIIPPNSFGSEHMAALGGNAHYTSPQNQHSPGSASVALSQQDGLGATPGHRKDANGEDWSGDESNGESGQDSPRKRKRPMSVSCELCKQRKVKCKLRLAHSEPIVLFS